MKRNFLLACLFCIGCSTGQYSLTEQNDFFAPDNQDGSYTQGVKFSYSPSTKSEGNAFGLGQQIYTPAHTQIEELQPNDRPYAGYLYGEAAHAYMSDPYTRDRIALQLGVIGPYALGEEAQNGVHRLIGDRTAKGWDNQIDNEPAVLFMYERQTRGNVRKLTDSLEIDTVRTAAVDLGNVFDQLKTGWVVRAGYGLFNDWQAGAVGPHWMTSSAQRGTPTKSWALYGFAGPEGRLVARNIFLDGNTFEDSHSVDRKWWVGGLRTGVIMRYGKFQLSYILTFMTDEFDEQNRNHRYGSVNIGWGE